MEDYRTIFNEIVDKITESLDEVETAHRLFLEELFNLLFWKDYIDGHVSYELKSKLIGLYKYYVKIDHGNESYFTFDPNKMNEVYSIINEVRSKIGLTEELPR